MQSSCHVYAKIFKSRALLPENSQHPPSKKEKKKNNHEKICFLVGSEGKLKMSASRYLVDADQRLSNWFISRAFGLTQITTDCHQERNLL